MQPWQQSIISIFNSKVKLEDDCVDDLLSLWTKDVTLSRQDILIDKGQIESNLFYVVKGSMRIFFPHEDEEICVGFAYDNNLICSYPSFIQNLPSQYVIQALGKTDVKAIARTDFYNLFDKWHSLERAWRMLEEDALIGKINRETEMLTFPPEERYNRLMERSPHIFQIIPRKYIASYLRMSPETLSRIRPS